jgi:hypothetical protein
MEHEANGMRFSRGLIIAPAAVGCKRSLASTPLQLVRFSDPKPRQMQPLPGANSIWVVKIVHESHAGNDWFELRQRNPPTMDQLHGAPEGVTRPKSIPRTHDPNERVCKDSDRNSPAQRTDVAIAMSFLKAVNGHQPRRIVISPSAVVCKPCQASVYPSFRPFTAFRNVPGRLNNRFDEPAQSPPRTEAPGVD